MKLKKIIRLSKQGCKEALKIRLDKEENWTPLLIHIHTSRLLVGLILGLLLGMHIGVVISLIIVNFY